MSGAFDGATETLAADTIVAGLSAPARAPARAPEQPAKIGRFTVLRQLGAGGMGVVYAAYDDQLDRKVAVKLLRHEPGLQASEGHARLLREAQALARLSHPNVVAVYEVGSFFDQVFLAMEFVQGQSLREWLEAAPRPWREVLRVFVQAGRGLAAAHAAGLVHRDFKPDNVVLGDDGRVRVLDFGLARAGEPTREEQPTLQPTTSRIDLSSQLTAVGAVVGTPAYIAPELYARLPADARSDQFAFCVSLWEALYGQRPFRGSSLGDLALAICDGAPEPPPRDRRVPAWLHAVALRGLHPDPERRFAGLDQLLAALDRDPERRRVRLLGAAVLACVAALIGLGVRNVQAARAGQCTGGAALIAGTWGHVQKDSLRAALVASGLAYARDTAERTALRLDAYAAAWAAAHRDACEDTAVRREQSQELLDLRMACLEGRRAALADVLGLLQEPGGSAVEHAVAMVEQLPAIEACENASYVRQTQTMPGTPAEAIRLATARKQLERIEALIEANRHHEAGPLLAALERQEPPPQARPAVALARCHVDGVLGLGGRRACEQAYLLARAVEDGRVAVLATRQLLMYFDDVRDRELWELWSQLAEVEVQRHGAPLDAIRLLFVRGRHARNASEYDRAEAVLTEALARCEADATCRRAATLVSCLTDLGLVLTRKGEGQRALELLRRAYDLKVLSHGKDHPALGTLLDYISGAYESLGDYERALAFAERALELRVRVSGRDSLRVADSYNNVAGLLSRLGDQWRALTYFHETARIEEARLGPDSAELALTLTNMASAMYHLEMYEEALPRLQRALAIQRVSRAPDHFETAITLSNMASVELYSGRFADAERHFREALPIIAARIGEATIEGLMMWQEFAQLLAWTDRAAEGVAGLRRVRAGFVAAFGESHPHLADFDTQLGDIENLAGDPVAAEATLRRAIARYDGMHGEGDPASLTARISLAGVLAERDPDESLRLSDGALAQARSLAGANSLRAGLYVGRATAQARLGDRAAAEASACLADGLLSRSHPADERARQELRALGLLRRACR